METSENASLQNVLGMIYVFKEKRQYASNHKTSNDKIEVQ